MKKIKVFVKRVCGCVKKSDLENMVFFENKEEARSYCRDFLETLQKNSCDTHHFFLEEREEEIIINSTLNTELFGIQ